MDIEELIESQIGYYRARAGEYDAWFERSDEYDLGPEFLDAWNSDVAELQGWLEEAPPTGHVLELAAGSGNWSGHLLKSADLVTAVDASPEMLELLASKHPKAETIVADIFSWTPPHRYDNVFLGFWLSHVPSAKWDEFWNLVERALLPDGRVWLIDSADPDYSAAKGPSGWLEAAQHRQIEKAGSEVRERSLRDGSRWTMVKRFWRPDELVAALGELGWLATAGNTDFAFLYGTAEPPN